MRGMDAPRFQLRVSTLLGLVACVALNIWLFRVGTLLGILGLNVTKHVAIAMLCQAAGVNRSQAPGVARPSASTPHLPRPGADGVRP